VTDDSSVLARSWIVKARLCSFCYSNKQQEQPIYIIPRHHQHRPENTDRYWPSAVMVVSQSSSSSLTAARRAILERLFPPRPVDDDDGVVVVAVANAPAGNDEREESFGDDDEETARGGATIQMMTFRNATTPGNDDRNSKLHQQLHQQLAEETFVDDDSSATTGESRVVVVVESPPQCCAICLEPLGEFSSAGRSLFVTLTHKLSSRCRARSLCGASTIWIVVYCIEAHQPQIRTVCHHVFHRPCLLTWMVDGSTTPHDDCPSCRYTPLYDTKVYRAQMAVEYPNVCVNNNTSVTAGGDGTTTTTTTTPRESAIVVVEQQRPTRQPCILYCVFVLAVLHLAMFGIFGQARRQQDQEVQNRNGSSGAAAAAGGGSFPTITTTTYAESYYCDGITLSLGSLLEREQTIYCAQNPHRPCSVCGGGDDLFDDSSLPPHLACYCYCRVELQRQSFVFTIYG
jgi:hypothetical protein